MESKQCTQCKKIKLLSEFPIDKKRKLGCRAACKECTNTKKRTYYAKFPEKHTIWNNKSIERRIEKCKRYRREYYLLNRKKISKEAHERYLLKQEEKKLQTKEWAKNNPEKVREYSRRKGIKLRTNPSKKLNRNMSYAIWLSIKDEKKSTHWENLLDYNLRELKKHIERQFLPGMAWENYGKDGWHIDHKIPKSAFNFKSPNDLDFKRCWSLSNLQPMWAMENIRKSNKIIQPFQPSLQL